MKNITTTFLAAILILGGAALASGETKCDLDRPIADCWQTYLPAVNQATLKAENKAKAETEAKADKALREMASGVDLSSLGTGGALLNTLARSGLIAASGDGDDAGGNPTTIAYDFNFLLPAPVRDRNTQLKMILNTKPTLWEPLKELPPGFTLVPMK